MNNILTKFNDDCSQYKTDFGINIFHYQNVISYINHELKKKGVKKSVSITIILAFFLITASGQFLPPDTVKVSPYGKVFIYKHSDIQENIVIMISGDGGWKYGIINFSQQFSKMNTLVIGVDILQYYKDLRQRKEDCFNVAADFVNLATVIEKKYNFPNYRPPVLMGYSSGATLVYGILAQARPGTFIGGISLGFCPDFQLPKMLCQHNGLTENVLVNGKSFIYQPDPKLGNPWIVLNGKLDIICNYSVVTEFVSKTKDAELVSLPNVGHGFTKWSDFMPQWRDAYTRLIDNYNKSLQPATSDNQINELPLSITDARFQNNEASIALFISGDGGWYWFEQSMADSLSKLGVPTIGLDSKKYFWNKRDPDQTAGDIAKVLEYYAKKWDRDRFIILGYSFGAEIVPFLVTRLPVQIISNIEASVLLSPNATTDFEIHILDMLGLGSRQNDYNVIEEIKKVKTGNILAIFGEAEDSQVSKQLTGTDVKIKYIPGDHHYNYDIPLIIKTLRNNNVFSN